MYIWTSSDMLCTSIGTRSKCCGPFGRTTLLRLKIDEWCSLCSSTILNGPYNRMCSKKAILRMDVSKAPSCYGRWLWFHSHAIVLYLCLVRSCSLMSSFWVAASVSQNLGIHSCFSHLLILVSLYATRWTFYPMLWSLMP